MSVHTEFTITCTEIQCIADCEICSFGETCDRTHFTSAPMPASWENAQWPDDPACICECSICSKAEACINN